MKYLVACLAVAVLVASRVDAVLLDVPGQYLSINEAVTGASSGDTVLVHPGTYLERIIFPATNFSLFSEYALTGDTSAISTTIIDASVYADEDTASVLVFVNGNDSSMVVCGFTIRGGHGTVAASGTKHGGGLLVVNSHPTIFSNHLTANQARKFAAAEFIGSCTRFSQNRVFANCATLAGLFGISYNYLLGQPLLFEWNDIYGNYGCPNGDSVPMFDPGVVGWEARYVVRYNHFHDYAGIQALAVEYSTSTTGELSGNIFERITGPGHLATVDRHDVAIRDNIFRDCQVTDWACVSLARPNMYGTSHVERNWFENIVNEGIGPACIFAQSPNIFIAENMFLNCLGGSAAGIQVSLGNGCLGSIERNQFFGNRLWDSGYPGLGTAITSTGIGSLCEVRQNWFESNVGPVIGYELSDQPPWDLSSNYWGDSTGPYHPSLNPGGQGDTLAADFAIWPWLTEPPLQSVPRPQSIPLANWELKAAYPNPFNITTNVRLISDQAQLLEVSVYNIRGQRVRMLWRGMIPRNGATNVIWNGVDESSRPCATGLYFITALPLTNSDRASQTTKVLLLK